MISTNDKIPYNNRRTAGVFRSVAMVLAIFVVSLVTLGILAYSGVNVPFFSNALNGSINGAGSGTSGGSSGGSSGGTGGGSGGGSMGNGSGGGSGSGIGGGAGGGTGSVSGSGSVDGSGSGSGSGSGAGGGWVGGAPSELMGSGGAWDGSEIRIPAMSLSYDSGEETEFCLYGNYLAECSRDSFSLLDSEGAEVFRKNIDFTKPALHKRGDYLLVSDIGGRSAFVMKGAKLVWEESFSSGIVNASINKNGYIAFVFDAVGYRNSVKIMAPMGKTLFDWVVADDYVLSSEIAPSGKELMINRLKTTGIGVSSGLEFFDINAEPMFTIDSDEGEVFLGVRYLDGGMLAVASEDVFRLYSERGELIIQEKYESIMAMCEFPRGKAAVAVRYNNRALVMEYDGDTPKGRVLYISEKPIVNMSADNGYLFINLGHEVVAIKDNGSIVSRLTLDSETLYGGASEKFGILAVTKKSADIFPF